jgi:hypothetical protein
VAANFAGKTALLALLAGDGIRAIWDVTTAPADA